MAMRITFVLDYSHPLIRLDTAGHCHCQTGSTAEVEQSEDTFLQPGDGATDKIGCPDKADERRQ